MAVAAALPVIATIATLAATAVAAYGSYSAANAQAKAGTLAAQQRAKWLERQAMESQVDGQRQASSRRREMQLAQSNLVAGAAASGGSATDETILDLYGDVQQEGEYNQRNAVSAAAQRSSGLQFEAGQGIWEADANSRIQKSSAKIGLIGNILGGIGQAAGGMSKRYNSGGSASSSSYSYGTRRS